MGSTPLRFTLQSCVSRLKVFTLAFGYEDGSLIAPASLASLALLNSEFEERSRVSAAFIVFCSTSLQNDGAHVLCSKS